MEDTETHNSESGVLWWVKKKCLHGPQRKGKKKSSWEITYPENLLNIWDKIVLLYLKNSEW